MTSPRDLILRISEPSPAEREFIQSEAKRRQLSIDALFKHWMQNARAVADSAALEQPKAV